MARMRIAAADRARVKLECLRLLATLRLDPARTRLVSGFVDSYLRLTGEERRLFEAEVRQVPEEERGKVMQIVTSWMEEGIEKGREEGREEGRKEGTLQLVLRQLARRVGELSTPTAGRIRSLSQTELEALAEALLDFQAPGELERWLSGREAG